MTERHDLLNQLQVQKDYLNPQEAYFPISGLYLHVYTRKIFFFPFFLDNSSTLNFSLKNSSPVIQFLLFKEFNSRACNQLKAAKEVPSVRRPFFLYFGVYIPCKITKRDTSTACKVVQKLIESFLVSIFPQKSCLGWPSYHT